MAFLALVVFALGACAFPNRGPDPCVITGGAPRSDVARARAACSGARQRFTAILGDAPIGTINLSPTQGLSTFTEGGRWTLTWPMSSRLAAGMPGVSGADMETRRFLDEQWQEVLPHELGHLMLGAFLYSPGRVLTGEYGTYMPDWVDEAVAISSPPCDGPCARERPGDTRIITERVFRDGRVTVDTAYVSGERALEADPLARFYILSYALWAYIEARGGRGAIDRLIERLRRNPRDVTAIIALPGLPRTAAAVEADWRRWLASTAATE